MAQKKKCSDNSRLEAAPVLNGAASSFNAYIKYAPLLLLVFFIVFYSPFLFKSYYLWEDVIEQHYPNAVYTMSSLKSGELPQWSPYVFGGMPYMADMQTGLFYPPNWLLFIFQSFSEPGGTVFIYFILLHILVFGFGIFRLSRSFNLSYSASLYAATATMFCGFISTHVIHIIFLYVIAWFPFAFLYLKKAYENGGFRNIGLASMFFGISILGGYAQYTLFLTSILFLYTCFFAYWNRGSGKKKLITKFFMFGIFMGLAGGLALIQLLPTFELSRESVRTKMTWDQSIEGSLSFQGLLTFLAPKFYGWISGITQLNQATGSWQDGSPYWGGSGAHIFWETACFVGIMPIMLFVAGFRVLRKNRMFRFFSILALLALLLALGKNGPLYYIVFNYVPGFGNFRLPGRFSFIFAFGFIMASAFSLDRFISNSASNNDETGKSKKALFVAAVAGIAVLLFSLTTTSGLEEAKKVCAQHAVGFGMFSILVSSSLILYLFKSGSKRIASFLIILFVFIELYFYGSTFGLSKVSGSEVYAPNPQIDALRNEIDKTPFRLQGRIFEGEGKGVRLFGHLNLGNVYHIPIVEGYNQLHLGRLSRFLHEVDPKKEMDLFNVKYRAKTNGQGFDIMPENAYCSRFSLRSNIKIVKDGDEAIKIINSPDFNPFVNVTIEEPSVLNMNVTIPTDSLGTVTIKSYSPHKIELLVDSKANCLLFASEVFYPAWKASLDGHKTEIHKTNFLFRGIEIPEGRHEVVFKYESSALKKGMIISSVILLAVIALIIFGDKFSLYGSGVVLESAAKK